MRRTAVVGAALVVHIAAIAAMVWIAAYGIRTLTYALPPAPMSPTVEVRE